MTDTPAWQIALTAFGGALTGGTFSLLGAALTNRLQRRRELELRLSERKQQVYLNLMNAMYHQSPTEVKQGALAVELLMVASDEVVRTAQEMAKAASLRPSPETEASMEQERLIQAKLILAMRRDSGTSRTTLGQLEVLRSIYDLPWN